MPFKEDGKFVGYKEINGKKVPHYLAETEVTLINKVTGKEYMSDKEADDDIKNPNTDTVKDHIRRDVKITVPKLVMGSGTSK
tara:strand:- start:78 stop:323 length:246 start_codon:yes stop_codon:yes gene_type:complete